MADKSPPDANAGDAAKAEPSILDGTSRHIANESQWKAFCISPDFCKVGNSVVPFDSFAVINNKQTASPNVFAAGKPVYRVGDIHSGVQGDAGQHIESGTSLGGGYVKILSGQNNVIVNGMQVARDGSDCKVNCDASGNGGAPGRITTETVPVQTQSCKPNAQLQKLIDEANDKRSLWQKTKDMGSHAWDAYHRMDVASGEHPGDFALGVAKGVGNLPGDIWNMFVSASKYSGDETGTVMPVSVQADQMNRDAMTAYQAGDVCKANKLASDADDMMQFGHVIDLFKLKNDAQQGGALVSAFIPFGGAVKGVTSLAKVGRGVETVNELSKAGKIDQLTEAERLADASKMEGGQVAKVPGAETPRAPDAETPKTPEHESGVHVKPKERLPEEKVPCFHPYDKPGFKKLSAAEQRQYLRDYAKQLSGQQDAINSLTATEYQAARDAYSALGRNPAADAMQEATRSEFVEHVRGSIFDSLKSSGMSNEAAMSAATEQANAVAGKLAALHEPDMVAGGWANPDPTRMGSSSVNSSIGGSWNQGGRLSGMDESAQNAIKGGKGGALMNVKLQPCRGKGMR